jgi:hypothetical protein
VPNQFTAKITEANRLAAQARRAPEFTENATLKRKQADYLGKGGAIPRERIAQILDREIEKRNDPDVDEGHQNGVEQLTQEVMAHTGERRDQVLRYLYTIRVGKVTDRNRRTGVTIVRYRNYIAFDQVDKIFQALDLTHLWHNELSDLYYSDLTQLPEDL